MNFKRSSIHRLLVLAVAAQACMMVAQAQPYAYVSNLSSNTVAVVNTANMAVANVPVPAGPTGLAVMPDGSAVYVASQSVNQVSVIGTGSNSVIASINVGATPTQLAISPNGSSVYVVNQGSDQVSVIDTGSKSVVATISVGHHPSAVAFSPDGSRAYVGNLLSGNVSVIDTGSRSVINTFATGSGPSGIVISPDNRTIYVSNEYSGTVTVHDASGNLQNTVNGLLYPNSIAMSPNGGRVLVTNGNGGSVSVIDTGSRSVVGTVGVGSQPTSVAISADGSRAYVTNEYAFSLSVIDTASNSVVNTVARIGVYPVAVAVVPGAVSASVPSQPPPPSPTCSYALSATAFSAGAGGATGSVNVTAPSGCAWNAASGNPDWLGLLSGSSGNGSGTVSFVVYGNLSPSPRGGNLYIAGQTFQISQAGSSVQTFSPVRVNAGGPAMTDSNGNAWAADSQRNTSSTLAGISNTADPAMYQKEAWSTGTLQYQLTVPNGTVTVKLRFAEFYLTQRGQRVFNIVINGNTVFQNFDILAAVGPNTAYDITFPVSVGNGQVIVQLIPVTGSPKLSGIEIY